MYMGKVVFLFLLCQLALTGAETFQVSFDDEVKECDHPNVLPNSPDPTSPVQRVKLPFTSLNEWQYRYFSAVKELQEIGHPSCQSKPHFNASGNNTDIFPRNTPRAFDPFDSYELQRIADFVQKHLNISLSEPKSDSTSLLADWLYALDMMPLNKSSGIVAKHRTIPVSSSTHFSWQPLAVYCSFVDFHHLTRNFQPYSV
jgi:hypothetical protein